MVRGLIIAGCVFGLVGASGWWLAGSIELLEEQPQTHRLSTAQSQPGKVAETADDSPVPFWGTTTSAPTRVGGIAQKSNGNTHQKVGNRKVIPQGPAPGETVTTNVRNVTPDWVTNRTVSAEALVRVEGRAVPPAQTPRPRSADPKHRTLVLDARQVRSGKTTVTFSDVIALPFKAYCLDPSGGGEWPCGRHARGDLRRLVGARSISCTPAKTELEQPALASLKVDLSAPPTPATSIVTPQSPPAEQSSAAHRHTDVSSSSGYQAGGVSLSQSQAAYNPGGSIPENVQNTTAQAPQRPVRRLAGVDDGSSEPLAARVQRQPTNAATNQDNTAKNGRNAIIRIRTQSAHCQVGTTAIGPWLVERGWAIPAPHRADEPTYVTALQAARTANAGLWRDPNGAFCIGSCRHNTTENLSKTIDQTDTPG